MPGYFGPLPKKKFDFDKFKQWLKSQTISVNKLVSGALSAVHISSNNWDGGTDLSGGQDTTATAGFLLDGADGSGQFMGSLWSSGTGFMDAANDNTHVGSIAGSNDELIIVGVGTRDVRVAALSGGVVAISVGGSQVASFASTAGHGLQGLATTTWAPDLEQFGGITHTTNYATYLRLGGLVVAKCRLTATAAGTAGNAIRVSLPVTAADANSLGGSFRLFDTGNTNFAGTVIPSSTTMAGFQTDQDGNALGITAPTIASGDVLEATFIYFT